VPISVPILTEDHLYGMIERVLFTGGSGGEDRVGLELELFPVVASCGAYRNLRLHADDAEEGLLAWLRGVADRHGWTHETDVYGNLRVELASGGTITLEPAGQIEYSGAPALSVADAVEALESFVAGLEREAGERGISLVARGYNDLCGDESELEVRKPRYLAMDEHFARTGPFGRKMMRSTCALQINLDFGGGGVAAERWRLANMIAPSLNAIFANSPYQLDGAHYRSFRYEIWRRLDPSRTGRLYDRPDLDPVADYLRFALDASVMMMRGDAGAFTVPSRPLSFRDWMAGHAEVYPDWEDWRNHLSTLFPDVRARGYMELRSIDALPRRYRAIAVGFAAELLRNPSLRRAALERIESRERIAVPGEEHGGFWRSDYETGRELFELFLRRVSRPAEAPFRRYLDDLLARDLTPADLTLRTGSLPVDLLR
jgi:glutamate--cysteine ligase